MDRLLYGVAYYDEYMPYDRLDKDIAMMKKAGINLVRIGESTWSTFEPHEGEFDFSHLDRVMDAMHKEGISVILGTPTYAVPTWMVKSHPDVLAITDKGRGLYGPRQIMDITNPTYLFYAERAIRSMMEHCAFHPSVIGVQIDNETKAYGTAGPNVQEKFKKYLRDKFGNLIFENPKLYDNMPDLYKGVSEDDILDYINYEFGFDYWSNRINAWEDFPDVRGTINGSLSGEFKRFQRALCTEFLTWQSEIVREYLRTDQFITHNTDFNWIGYSFGINGETDVCDNANALDIVGVDIYHPSQKKLTGMEIAFGGDVSRSLKQDNYFVLETQAQGYPGWTPFKGQLRLQAYAHLANGADMVEYWHWHSLHNSMETYWKGVLSHDFKENDTYKAVLKVGNEWKSIGNKLIHLNKNNDVAILVSQESLSAIERFPIDEKNKLTYNAVLMKLYNCLYRMNIECDFMWPQQIDRINDYKLIIIPAMYCMPQDIVDAIETYVRNGGHVLMTFKSAFADEHVKVYSDEAPHGLSKVFGISYSQFSWPDGDSLVICDKALEEENCKKSSRECGSENSNLGNADGGCSLEVMNFMELLKTDTAAVLASYDSCSFGEYAAITCNDYGNGHATYLGCDISNELLERLLEYTLKKAGIETDDLRYPIVHRRGVNKEGNVIHYFMNFSDSEKKIAPRIEGTEILSGKKITENTELLLDAWGVQIIW